MPAIEYDIEIDEGRVNSFNMRWLDKDDNPVDLTDYGALAEIRTPDGERVARITKGAGITISEPDPEIAADFAADGGKFTVTFPIINKPKSYDCLYEIVLHPSSASPSVNPQALFRGKCKIRKQIASLDE